MNDPVLEQKLICLLKIKIDFLYSLELWIYFFKAILNYGIKKLTLRKKCYKEKYSKGGERKWSKVFNMKRCLESEVVEEMGYIVR